MVLLKIHVFQLAFVKLYIHINGQCIFYVQQIEKEMTVCVFQYFRIHLDLANKLTLHFQ